MRSRATAAGFVFLLAASSGCSQPQSTTLLQTATRPSAIPRKPSPSPPRGAQLAGKAGQKSGSSNVSWHFPDAPKQGVDALRITMTPQRVDTFPKNFVYWAFQGAFMDKSVWYMGLQPNGEFGETALFSVFGKGTSAKSASCKEGADGGAGTHCHIQYPWALGKPYELIVTLASADSVTMTWEGAVADLESGAVTVIGDFSVEASRGLLSATGVTFSEFFKRPTPCAEQPRSEVLFDDLYAYRTGKAFEGVVSGLNDNAGCGPTFFGDGKKAVYLGIGL